MVHLVLDRDLNSQIGENKLVAAFRKAVEWTPSPVATHPIFNLNPVRAFAHWYYARIMDYYINSAIQERLRVRSAASGQYVFRAKGVRDSVIDLAVDEYLLQQEDKGNKTTVDSGL